MNDIPDKFVSEGQTLNFTITSIDVDSDPLTYTTNATKGSLNMTSGQFIWKPAYSDSGVYFWIFTANDGYGGTATKIVKITVNIPPVAICGLDKLKCENVASLVQFNGTASYDPDGTIVSYYWEFDDGTTSLDSAPVHIYNNYKWNGSAYLPFMVNLTVIDNKGASNSTSQKVIIWIKADANGDGKVDIFDASTIGIKWGSNNPCADLNNDGIVNIIDAVMIGLNWGSSA
jgi:PKD repeat protein